jgi:hypothetical protein
VSKIPGVREIDDDLEVHASPDVPGLQGAHLQHNPVTRVWTPALRLAIGAGAAGLAVMSLVRGHPFGFVTGAGTVLALAKSIVGRSVRPLGPPRLGRGQRRGSQEQLRVPTGNGEEAGAADLQM